MGDEAVLAGTLAGLQALGVEAQPVVYSYDPHATTQQHGIAARHMKTVNTLAIASRLSQVRGLVLGGGGILNDYRLSGLAFYAHWAAIARMLRRPVMLHAVGVGPLRTRSGRAIARWIARACSRIGVRDQVSLDLLNDPRALLAADPALLVQPARIPCAVADFAAIVPRAWAEGCPVDAMAGLADYLSRQGLKPVLLGMHPQRDAPVVRAVRERAKEAVSIVEGPLSPEQALALLGSARLVFSMRLHGVLFAAMSGVPVVGLACDEKIAVLLSELGCPQQAVSPNDTNTETVIDAARRTLATRDELRPRLLAGCEKMKARAQAGIRLLAEFISDCAR
jgi:polysaccharide pyruvyl transferase CsaB